MGQKVNPIGFRLPITRDWGSRWYASRKDFADYLLADGKIRESLKKKLKQAAVARIVIERAWNSLRVTIHTARPGVVIGRRGSEIENLTKEVSDLAGGKSVKIDIVEIKSPDLVKDGKLFGITYQTAEGDGALSVQYAADWFNGKKLAVRQNLAQHIITAEDVEGFYPPQW